METPEDTGERRQEIPLLQDLRRCLRGSLTHDPEDYTFYGHVSGLQELPLAGQPPALHATYHNWLPNVGH